MHPFSQEVVLLFLCLFGIKCDYRIGSFVDLSDIHDVYLSEVRVYDANRRRRREDINSNVYYTSKLKIVHLRDWVLELNVDHNLFPPGQTEWITKDGIKYNRIQKCEYKSGYVRDFQNSSTAAISICDENISGFFTINSDTFFIEPNNETHVIYRKTVRQKRSWDFFNLTGDTIDIEFGSENEVGTNNVDVERPAALTNETLEWKREQIDSEEVGYFFDTAWQPSVITAKNNRKISTNPQRWLEIAIAVDSTVISFHGKQRVEQYVLTLMNIVNAIYQDPSLDANLQLIVSRLILYDNIRQTIVRPGNAKKSLENVNIWNRGMHIGMAPGETHHDVAVWITRSDIGGPSGYAPVAGACDPERSCALNRDEGLTSAFIIAHEMAHILGLSHDGDKKALNDCGDEALQGSVMAPLVSATFHQFLWSQCSRREFQKKSKKWGCLINPPNNNGISLNSTLQTSFSMDEQCRMEFGEGYSLCRAFDIVEPCSHLWCGHVKSLLVCKTKKGPPIEGTECGFDKWCVNGYCEFVDRKKFNLEPVQHNPQDGGWGDWGSWGSCSRTCGTGVEFRVRKCDNPVPIYGGSECFGSKEEWRICNTKACPEPIQDIRAQQCKRLPRILKLKAPRSNMTWLPYESEQYDMKCKLICSSRETKELYVTEENFIDGTPCSYENQSNICIQGICQPFGCDKQIFSTKREDACGVCGGNNTECDRKTAKFQRKLKRDVVRVAVIPRLAREIKVEANFSTNSPTNPSVAFILKDRKRSSYTITIPNHSTGNQIIEGTKFYYKKISGMHLLWAKGPILVEIALLVYASKSQIDTGLNISLVSEYYLHKNMTDVNTKYKWIVGGWGSCSKTCGGGRRHKTKACWDVYGNKIASRKFCSIISKPPTESEKCNTFSCNFYWVTGNWEGCSATCGNSGIQNREIYCIPQSSADAYNSTYSNEPWRLMVSPDKCGGNVQPMARRPCFRRPCPSYWEYGDWSQCSSSCGVGISVRVSHCTSEDDENLLSCGELAPKQRRFCKGLFNKKTNVLCRTPKLCLGDYSRYCSIALLGRYCKISSYRNFCCKSCSRRRILPFIQ